MSLKSRTDRLGSRRPDILIQAEKVRGIVLLFASLTLIASGATPEMKETVGWETAGRGRAIFWRLDPAALGREECSVGARKGSRRGE